jgi:hypothetical protein
MVQLINKLQLNKPAWFSAKMLFILILCVPVNGGPVYPQKSKNEKDLTVQRIELGYPCPGIPYYHVLAELELPQPSIIEVEASVNGKTLRATELRRMDAMEHLNRPHIANRPPSSYGMAQDGTLYSHFCVIGWVKWQPGEDYAVRVTVRIKKTIHPSDDDVLLTAGKNLKAPSGVPVFDSNWKNYKSVVLSETAGIDRTGEPVEVLLAFYPDEAQQIERDIRVVAVDPEDHSLSEVTSQVYDVRKFTEQDDLAPDENGTPARKIPLWLPTVTARVAFLADVKAGSSRVFLVYYNNENARNKLYKTDLQVLGEQPGLQIDNSKFTIFLHPASGHLDQITLKSKPDAPLFHRMETNGAIHWNPGIYVPPRPWSHTADWKPPAHMHSVAGPVIAKSDVWDHLRGVPEVDASVRYEFYPGLPYFKSSTVMRINENLNCLALRNAEIVFKRELMTRAAWYDIISDSVIVYDVGRMPDLTDLRMEADVPWITFYNEETGVGFAGIQLEYANSGLESETRLLNPFFYITGGPWIYWARGLSHSYLSSNMQQIIPVLKGSEFSEKWAYLVYETDKGGKPYAPVLVWQKRLTQPLRLQVVEEVDDRVSKSLEEIYMDKGKSGWEERETGKHDRK